MREMLWCGYEEPGCAFERSESRPQFERKTGERRRRERNSTELALVAGLCDIVGGDEKAPDEFKIAVYGKLGAGKSATVAHLTGRGIHVLCVCKRNPVPSHGLRSL